MQPTQQERCTFSNTLTLSKGTSNFLGQHNVARAPSPSARIARRNNATLTPQPAPRASPQRHVTPCPARSTRFFSGTTKKCVHSLIPQCHSSVPISAPQRFPRQLTLHVKWKISSGEHVQLQPLKLHA